MKLSQFKFKLPEEQIAQYPAHHRDESRLMVLHKKSGDIEHRQYFKDILDYFDDKDVFIFNDTKVFPARLYGNKEKTGARIEVFLLRELNEDLRLWDVLVDPARKIRIGNKLYFGEDDSMVAEVIDNTTSRGRTLRFLYDGPHDEFKEALYALGEAPLLCKEGVVALGNAFQLGRPRLDVGGKGFFLLCGVFGTGAGGGIIANGQLVRGVHFTAGEYSFVNTNAEAWDAPDQNMACQCSTSNLLKWYRARKALPEDAPLDGRSFFAAANAGEPEALEVLRRFCHAVAVQIYNLTVLLDVEKVAIGGGISKQPLLLESLRSAYDGLYASRAGQAYMEGLPRCQIVPCAFSSEANQVGVAAAYFEAMQKKC